VAIPRIRTTDRVQLVYSEDSCVLAPEGEPRWLERTAEGVSVSGAADVITVHPLGGSDLRAIDALDAGQSDVALVARAFVDLNGRAELEEVAAFPRQAIVTLARAIRRLSNPVPAIVAEEAATSAGKSAGDGL